MLKKSPYRNKIFLFISLVVNLKRERVLAVRLSNQFSPHKSEPEAWSAVKDLPENVCIHSHSFHWKVDTAVSFVYIRTLKTDKNILYNSVR